MVGQPQRHKSRSGLSVNRPECQIVGKVHQPRAIKIAVAHIPECVAIGTALIAIRRSPTVVAGIADTVAPAVLLLRCCGCLMFAQLGGALMGGEVVQS